MLVADDHAIVRTGIRHVLETEPGFTVVAEASNGAEALALAIELSPDVAVLDISMPGMSGLQTAAELRRRAPDTRILMLSMHDNTEYVLESLRAGVHGYLLKDSAAAELGTAIRAVCRGESFFSPPVARQLGAVVRGELGAERPGTLAQLTSRERQVLVGVAGGPHQQGDRAGARHQPPHGREPSREPDAQARRLHGRGAHQDRARGGTDPVSVYIGRMSKVKTGIVMMNLGGPANLDEVEPFLLELFADREIIQLPFQRWLGPFIARRRAPKVRGLYEKIGGGSPSCGIPGLRGRAWSSGSTGLSPETAPHGFYVAFRYVQPKSEDALRAMAADGVERAVAFTQYPQFSCSTTGSSLNELWRAAERTGLQDAFEWSIIDRWPVHDGFIASMTETVREGLRAVRSRPIATRC